MIPVSPVVLGFNIEEVIYAKDQPQYNQLPAFKSEDGQVVTRWKLTFIERIRLLFTGNLWLTVLTFNRALQPVKLDTLCPLIRNGE